MDHGLDDLEWDPVASVNKVPLSYLLFNFIPQNLFKFNSNKSEYISSLVYKVKEIVHSKYPFVNHFLSGSMAEGLGLSISTFVEGFSDLDIMMAYPISYKTLDDSSKDLHPGYVRLIKDDVDPCGEYAENGVKYMRNNTLNEMKESDEFEVAGPSLRAPVFGPVIGDVDFVTCLPCRNWPQQAEEWVDRLRPSGWPSKQLIHHIVSGGCHVVPVAHPNSSFPLFDWRYSFSKAEVHLSKSLSFHQKTCYILFKLLAKHATTKSNILKTYYLKNIMFHCCERIPDEFWKPRYLSTCLFELIDSLLDGLERGEIPHFFIKINNLISHLPHDRIEALKQELLSLRRSPIDHLIQLANSGVIRFNLRNSVAFEDMFNEVIQCLPQGITPDIFYQTIDKTERKLALCYLKDDRILLSIDCFKDRHVFFDGENKVSYESNWQLRLISFLEQSLEYISPCPMISTLVMLSHDEFVTVNTTKLKDDIKSIVEKRFDYQGILQTFPFDHFNRVMFLLYYSVYHLVTGHYETAYLHAKTALDDSKGDLLKVRERMDLALSFGNRVIWEKAQSVSGITEPTVYLNALYLAAKSIKYTKYKNRKGHSLDTEEDTFRNKDKTFKKVDVLLIALIYMETNQFIAAAKFYCMEFHDTLHDHDDSRNVWQLRKDILTSLVLELLQISTIDEFLKSPKFASIAERTLDLISYNLLHDVESIDEIGDVFNDLKYMYSNSNLLEFNDKRMVFAYNAAENCRDYFRRQVDKAIHLSLNWA